MVRRLVVVAACALALASHAEAGPLLGVHGDLERFRSLTGQESAIRLVFVGWNQGYLWGKRFEQLGVPTPPTTRAADPAAPPTRPGSSARRSRGSS